MGRRERPAQGQTLAVIQQVSSASPFLPTTASWRHVLTMGPSGCGISPRTDPTRSTEATTAGSGAWPSRPMDARWLSQPREAQFDLRDLADEPGQDLDTHPRPGDSIGGFFARQSTGIRPRSGWPHGRTDRRLGLDPWGDASIGGGFTHSAILNAVLSPGGRTLATETDDEIVTLWDVESGLPLKSIPVLGLVCWDPETGHSWGDAAFSPDGRFLAVSRARTDLSVLPWDTEIGTRRQLPPLDLHRLRFLPDGAPFSTITPTDSIASTWQPGIIAQSSVWIVRESSALLFPSIAGRWPWEGV